MNAFLERLGQFVPVSKLQRVALDTIQVNVGLRCNLACQHCHVAASPKRQEMMAPETFQKIVQLVRDANCRLVDITGGAPELNDYLPEFIRALKRERVTIQVRTNLVIYTEPGWADFANFLKAHQVHLVGSLPCYLEENVDAQRGDGVFNRSIEAIQMLNRLGYGVHSALPLNLVYNPRGPSLPPPQCKLEADYKRELKKRFGIAFTTLLTLINMPIGRFQSDLQRQGEAKNYHQLLYQAFNPDTVKRLMCLNQVTIAWDGTIYDCDFNLALGHPNPMIDHIRHCSAENLSGTPIFTDNHCLGCTAGSGSSCGGALTS
ncbi:arsenosugar biosynthesis radical SAM (seleno)protein ArsS [Magnetococcales bacterium HHB-1]